MENKIDVTNCFKELYLYSQFVRKKHQSFLGKIAASGETIHQILSIFVDLSQIWSNLSEKKSVQKKKIGQDNLKENEKEEKERDRNTRITVGALSILGIFGLSEILDKDFAKIKASNEIEKIIDTLDKNQDDWIVSGEKDEFIKEARKLAEKVKTNTTHLRIIPNLITLTGCGFALIGACFKSYEMMKGGGYFAFGGFTIHLIVNTRYSDSDHEIYQLADRIYKSCNNK